ncbi:MAG TPA: protein-disulfide reductase DsbD [Steroidobacteraceae bacterium]|nr:protein-disulfide reductase DsbD [Steroidobacteraceae bacterium]
MKPMSLLPKTRWPLATLGALLLLALAGPAARAADASATPVLPVASGSQDFLPPEVAFRVAARVEAPDRVRLSWAIAPGYYLYKSRLKFATSSPGLSLAPPELPEGDTKTDEYFGKQVVYHMELIAHLGVKRAPGASHLLDLAVTYQGCAEAGLCYPPITRPFKLDLEGGAALVSAATAGGGSEAGAGTEGYLSEQDKLAGAIRGGSLATMLALFFAAGLVVAFTGCVLPTVPILSSIIIGQGSEVTTLRSFALSLTYVLGMALTYTVAGALTAASGLQVQAMFQQTWIVVLFAMLIVAMAASMFGAFTVQMPAFIQSRVADLSNRQHGGTFGGVAVMGMLSALIITACVAPAMIAALTVISQSGNVVRGASALFAMSMGMGFPLLLIGTSAGRLLPRAGAWMDDVKRLGGCLMLGVAAWMIARLLSDTQALLLYAVPVIAAVIVLWRFAVRGTALKLARFAALASALYAAALVVGFAQGANNPLHPLAGRAAQGASPQFLRVRTLAELDRAVSAASAGGRAVMLDFYADWCVSCKEMEHDTFSDPAVSAAMGRMTLLRADVTANDENDRALLQRFGIFGPPTIAFYGADGTERRQYRVVGYMKSSAFLEVLARVAAPST